MLRLTDVWIDSRLLREKKEELGLTCRQIADRAGKTCMISDSVIALWLRTKRPFKAHRKKVMAVAAALEVSFEKIEVIAPQEPVVEPKEDAVDVSLQEIAESMRLALLDPSPVRFKDGMSAAIRVLKPQVKSKRGAARLFADASRELASATSVDAERSALWRARTEVLDAAWKKFGDWRDLAAYGNAVADLFYDLSERTTNDDLLRTIKLLGGEARKQSNNDVKASLLVQQSSLLRCLSMAEGIKPEDKEDILGRMRRCAARACSLAPAAGLPRLELAQAEWAFARSTRDYSEYVCRKEIASSAFADAAASGMPVAILGQARFYRQGYEPELAVECFRQYDAVEIYRRRLWRNSFVLGEAATQLGYGPTTDCDAIEYARDAVANAVSAGYGDARTIIALARLEAVSDGVSYSERGLMRLSTRQHASLSQVLEAAMSCVGKDLAELRHAFAYGLEDGANWNALGTYVKDHLADPKLALQLYEIGLKLASRRQIKLLWLNKARLLEQTDPVEALRCVGQAQATCDVGFTPFVLEVRERLAAAGYSKENLRNRRAAST